VSFLQDTASELIYPILPIFLTSVLGAPVAVVGVVEGAAEAAASVAKVTFGRLGDRFRRRPLIGTGYGLAALGKMVVAAATVWPVVLVGRFVDRVGKGIRGAPRDALLVADIPPAARGRAFGFHRSMDTAGAVVGPLIGLAGYELLHHHLRPLLVLAVIPAILSVPLVSAVRESPVDRSTVDRSTVDRSTVDRSTVDRSTTKRRAATTVPLRQLPGDYWKVVVLLGAFSLVNFPDALLILRLRALHFSVVAVILAYVTYNLVYALLSFPAGLLADRWPRGRVFGMGLVFFAVGYLGLGLTHSSAVAWTVMAVYGGFTAFTDGVGKAWVSGLAPERSQATAQGTYQGLIGACVLLAGVWAGLAWHRTGAAPLIASGAIAAAMALYLLIAGGGPTRRPD
jgi:MFS family permease